MNLHYGAQSARSADLRLEAGIGRCASGCHGRRSSMLHDVGGARTRAFFTLTNRWQRDGYGVRLVPGTFSRVEECFGVVQTRLDVNVSFHHKSQSRSYNLCSGGMTFPARHVCYR